MTTYTIKRAGFILGRYQLEGAEIDLNDRQARLYLLEGRIERPTRAPQIKRGGGGAKKASKDAPDAGEEAADS